MRQPIEIENIAELRRREGIDDVELGEAIRGLRAGDYVKLTFLTPNKSFAGETLVVRITSIKGGAFRGKLAAAADCADLPNLRAGFPVAFTRDHIHSTVKGRPKLERDGD
jgi:hypothetical protein